MDQRPQQGGTWVPRRSVACRQTEEPGPGAPAGGLGFEGAEGVVRDRALRSGWCQRLLIMRVIFHFRVKGGDEWMGENTKLRGCGELNDDLGGTLEEED